MLELGRARDRQSEKHGPRTDQARISSVTTHRRSANCELGFRTPSGRRKYRVPFPLLRDATRLVVLRLVPKESVELAQPSGCVCVVSLCFLPSHSFHTYHSLSTWFLIFVVRPANFLLEAQRPVLPAISSFLPSQPQKLVKPESFESSALCTTSHIILPNLS